jgi:hypothetical protein
MKQRPLLRPALFFPDGAPTPAAPAAKQPIDLNTPLRLKDVFKLTFPTGGMMRNRDLDSRLCRRCGVNLPALLIDPFDCTVSRVKSIER